ncbi:hypothetical protein [Actinoplanes sp. L3-i22]|uniref:hypothetical protein n=1 Tax=Actinoplanes sp. L3-i22 TaxID=2836373 RepID=UPI001C793D28|nr:hypothetical protein [Actinoplanes sp. L3-i22]BCY13488.1 hypothetical protein L3i22_085760 [Actinoplanes sp. L3-i22]
MREVPRPEERSSPSSIEMLIFHPSSAAARSPETASRIPHQQERSPSATPVADDLRIFGLLRLLRQDELEEQGLDVESRPLRGYQLRFSSAGSVRPEYHTVVLNAGAQARSYGLGVMFPPYTVHARKSTSPPVDNDCELTQVDHVHIRRAEVPQDDSLRSAPIREILAQAHPDQDNAAVVRELRAALADQLAVRTLPRPVRAACLASAHEATTVVLGDDAMTRLDPGFVLEQTAIPAGALLAADEDLARAYVDLLADPQDNPVTLAAFLHDLVEAAATTTDENLLGYADGLPQQHPTLLGLFGLVTATQSTSIQLTVPTDLYTNLTTTPYGFAQTATSYL